MHHEKPNILVLSYAFPPSADIGARRFANLSRILHDNYFNLHILTATENCFAQTDYSISYSGNIHRITAMPRYPIKKLKKSFIDISLGYVWENYLIFIDSYCGWIIPSIVKGLRIIKKYKINLLLVTGPPFSSIVTAYLLSRYTDTKLIIDYRDPWTNTEKSFSRVYDRKSNIFFEKRAIKQASAAVVVSPMMRDNFYTDFSLTTSFPCYVITNGFNPATESVPLKLEDNKKVILYAGTFYGQRSIGLLLEPLTALIKQNVIDMDCFRIHVFGKLTDADKQNISSFSMSKNVREHQFVEHKTLLQYMKGADILYLPSGTEVPHAITGKFFDYLSVQRPILTIAPERSSLEQMMREIKCGEFAPIDDKEAIKIKLQTLFTENNTYSFAGAENYTWNKIAEQYAHVINSVLASS